MEFFFGRFILTPSRSPWRSVRRKARNCTLAGQTTIGALIITIGFLKKVP